MCWSKLYAPIYLGDEMGVLLSTQRGQHGLLNIKRKGQHLETLTSQKVNCVDYTHTQKRKVALKPHTERNCIWLQLY